MKKQKVLIIGNKQYSNFKLDNILDTFDIIYRFNLAWPDHNNGTKFGKLAMCGHIYHNFAATNPSKEQIMEKYSGEYNPAYLSEWYDFFESNKNKFEKIFHLNEHQWGEWNRILSEYGCPYTFPTMATTGYSAIFTNLRDSDNEIFVSNFTFYKDEIKRSMGVSDQCVDADNRGDGCHSFSDETKILNWLHKNKKIDASLCMLDDAEEISINTNNGTTEPSEFILNLLNRKNEENR